MPALLQRFLFSIALLLAAGGAADAKFTFGTDETIHLIQDVKVTGPSGEALFLGYKTSTTHWGAPAFIKDDGYVLGQKDDHKKYFNMPQGEELKSFQARGLLPDPLPSYKLSTWDYVFGHLLWIVLGGLALWGLVSFMRKKKPAEAAAEANNPG